MTTDNPSFFPRQLQLLSGSALKFLACLTMFVDHFGGIILSKYAPAGKTAVTLLGKSYSYYHVSRGIGRIAFPIFCFLLIEGFEHTHDRLKYGRNLLLFALISEIPWNLAHGNLLYRNQNIYFTLFFSYLAIYLVDHFKEKPLLQLISLFAILFVTLIFRADYSYRGYVFILIMYFLRTQRAAQALIGSCWLKYEWVASYAFIPINMYNGKRGFIRKPWMKFAFYAFYPVHLLFLTILRHFLFGT